MSKQENLLEILHISDLQFGSCGQGPMLCEHAKEIASKLLEDLELIQSYYDITPKIMVISGDIAEKAKPSEYKAAAIFIEDISKKSGAKGHWLFSYL